MGPHTLNQEMEGAARYFSSRDFRKRKASDLELIPVVVKSKLMEHALGLNDRNKLAMAEKAFGN